MNLCQSFFVDRNFIEKNKTTHFTEIVGQQLPCYNKPFFIMFDIEHSEKIDFGEGEHPVICSISSNGFLRCLRMPKRPPHVARYAKKNGLKTKITDSNKIE